VDEAEGLNPCGEIPLCNKELCNLAETCPTVCETTEEWMKACEYASFYCSTVNLLPTHSTDTNMISMRNRRIGVSIIDWTGWAHANGVHKTIRWMRDGYKVIRQTNRDVNAAAGVPESIRVTTIKPGGTTPKLAGRTSGIGYPTFHHTIRRVRVAKNKPIAHILINSGVPYENDKYSANTLVFEFPILQGPAKAAQDVTLWEQATNLALIQREWADNAVSNTLYFKPKWLLNKEWSHVPTEAELFHFLVRNCGMEMANHLEKEIHLSISEGVTFENDSIRVSRNPEYNTVRLFQFNPHHEEDDIEAVLSFLAPVTKSGSLLPHTAEGVYDQMPESGCTPEEYQNRLDQISDIDWSILSGSDGEDTRFCEGDQCEIPVASANG
jgi:ribonucleoside-diphosphate reductase alpha chain